MSAQYRRFMLLQKGLFFEAFAQEYDKKVQNDRFGLYDNRPESHHKFLIPFLVIKTYFKLFPFE
jgi:hypothetical protein